MKTIIISGGCGLLGQEFVKTLSKDNKVVILDLYCKVKEYINSDAYNADFYILFCDITNENEVISTIKFIHKQLGHIDILINAAAINPVPKVGEDNSFENYGFERWKATLDTNLNGSFLLSRECIKYMLKNKNGGFRGIIINIASDLGIITSDHSIYENEYKKPPDYGVSKAGLIHLTKYIAGYYKDKIKAICLAPGSVYNGQSDSLKKNLEDRIPLGRLARTDEYNEAIKFLCNSGSDYMQGQCLVMDGGRSIW